VKAKKKFSSTHVSFIPLKFKSCPCEKSLKRIFRNFLCMDKKEILGRGIYFFYVDLRSSSTCLECTTKEQNLFEGF
jgi:hypothetical protein